MAEFRNIHTRIWKDEWFTDLEVDEKLLFIYLFSNQQASVCGMYELPIKFISFETGIDKDRVIEILNKFSTAGKVHYEDGVVWVVNLNKYNNSGNSDKVRTRIVKDLEIISDDCSLKKLAYEQYQIPYPYPTDTLSNMVSRDGDGDGDRNGDGDDEEATDTDIEELLRTQTANVSFVGNTSPDVIAQKIFTDVTGMATFPAKDEKQSIHAITALLARYDRQKIVTFLKPFYRAWVDRGYMKTNCAWLTEWAVAGEIPTKNTKPQSQYGDGTGLLNGV